MGSKIAEKIVKPTPVPEAKQRNVQEITIPLDKRQGKHRYFQTKTRIIKWNTAKYLNY